MFDEQKRPVLEVPRRRTRKIGEHLWLGVAAGRGPISPYRFVQVLHDAGAEVLSGSALPWLDPGFSMPRQFQAFVLGSLTPYQALTTGTRNVAAYFGTLDSTGTVAVGKRADLLVLDANPLDDIRNVGQVAGVMAAGRWLSRAAIEARLNYEYRHVMKPLKRRSSTSAGPRPRAVFTPARPVMELGLS